MHEFVRVEGQGRESVHPFQVLDLREHSLDITENRNQEVHHDNEHNHAVCEVKHPTDCIISSPFCVLLFEFTKSEKIRVPESLPEVFDIWNLSLVTYPFTCLIFYRGVCVVHFLAIVVYLHVI